MSDHTTYPNTDSFAVTPPRETLHEETLAWLLAMVDATEVQRSFADSENSKRLATQVKETYAYAAQCVRDLAALREQVEVQRIEAESGERVRLGYLAEVAALRAENARLSSAYTATTFGGDTTRITMPRPTPSEAQPMSETRKDEVTHCGDECGTWNECKSADRCLGRATPTPPEQGEVREALMRVLDRAHGEPWLALLTALDLDPDESVSIQQVSAMVADALLARVPAEGVTAWEPRQFEYDRAIHHNPDAKAWADLWFANAMMAMRDSMQTRARATPPAAETGET